MSHFYGGVRGGRGEATRCGSKRAGLQAYAKSWLTCVEVHYEHVDGEDQIRVVARDIDTGSTTVLWRGSEDELLALLESQ